jgi:hypothetical protein
MASNHLRVVKRTMYNVLSTQNEFNNLASTKLIEENLKILAKCTLKIPGMPILCKIRMISGDNKETNLSNFSQN